MNLKSLPELNIIICFLRLFLLFQLLTVYSITQIKNKAK